MAQDVSFSNLILSALRYRFSRWQGCAKFCIPLLSVHVGSDELAIVWAVASQQKWGRLPRTKANGPATHSQSAKRDDIRRKRKGVIAWIFHSGSRQILVLHAGWSRQVKWMLPLLVWLAARKPSFALYCYSAALCRGRRGRPLGSPHDPCQPWHRALYSLTSRTMFWGRDAALLLTSGRSFAPRRQQRDL